MRRAKKGVELLVVVVNCVRKVGQLDENGIFPSDKPVPTERVIWKVRVGAGS